MGNGQSITIVLTATIAGRAHVIRGHARINHGHYRIAVSPLGRQTDFLTAQRGTGGDRWNYTLTYAGSSSLRPTRITGQLILEIEHR